MQTLPERDIEKPFQDMLDRSDRYENAVEKAAQDTWDDLQFKRNAEELSYGINASEMLGQIIVAVAELEYWNRTNPDRLDYETRRSQYAESQKGIYRDIIKLVDEQVQQMAEKHVENETGGFV
jgi:hypothetical protein